MNSLVWAVPIHSPTHLKLLWQHPSAQWLSYGLSQMDMPDLFRFNHVGELERRLIRLFKYILDTPMQPFYFCDWACGCLLSATAALITGVQVRKQFEQQDGRESTETQRQRLCSQGHASWRMQVNLSCRCWKRWVTIKANMMKKQNENSQMPSWML